MQGEKLFSVSLLMMNMQDKVVLVAGSMVLSRLCSLQVTEQNL